MLFLPIFFNYHLKSSGEKKFLLSSSEKFLLCNLCFSWWEICLVFIILESVGSYWYFIMCGADFMFSRISYSIMFGAFTWRTWAVLLGFHGWHLTLWLGAHCDVEGRGLMLFPFLVLLMFCHCSHMFISEEFFTLGELCLIASSHQYGK